jgi:hypothetical protein
MQKTIITILIILSCKITFGQNYATQLQKVNQYLKTFDNGYYGYMEIKDGYLYDRFPSGKYTKTLISDLANAEEEIYNRKVRIPCKSNNECAYSTYTDSYHNQLSFSQTSDFNTSELITLFNNLLAAYNNKPIVETPTQDKIGSNTDNTKSTSVSQNTTTNKDELYDKLKAAFDELNAHLPSLDYGRYISIDVHDDYIFCNYEGNEYAKAKIEDIEYVKADPEYDNVGLYCKGSNRCVYSSITGGYHDSFNFNTTKSNNAKTEKLLNNFLSALKNYMPFENKKNTTTNTTTTTSKTEAQLIREKMNNERREKSTTPEEEEDFAFDSFEGIINTPSANNTIDKNSASNQSQSNNNYATALKNLNEYLKFFNSETYRDIEVKEGKVYFAFAVYSVVYKSYIDISELKNNTIVVSNLTAAPKEIRISCKNEKNCFNGGYLNTPSNHFRFFSYTVKDFTKMEQLVKDFINAL